MSWIMNTLRAIVEIKEGVESATLEVNTLAIPRLLLFDADRTLVATMSPPSADSDLLAYLDGVLDGFTA